VAACHGSDEERRRKACAEKPGLQPDRIKVTFWKGGMHQSDVFKACAADLDLLIAADPQVVQLP
jgi:hypothetical protein